MWYNSGFGSQFDFIFFFLFSFPVHFGSLHEFNVFKMFLRGTASCINSERSLRLILARIAILIPIVKSEHLHRMTLNRNAFTFFMINQLRNTQKCYTLHTNIVRPPKKVLDLDCIQLLESTESSSFVCGICCLFVFVVVAPFPFHRFR